MRKFYKRITVNGKTTLEHRLVAEDKLGRALKKGEIVHHMDEDRFNNSPDNLMVMRSRSDHALLHSGSTPVYCNIEDNFYCNKNEFTCEDCGLETCRSSGVKTCLACYHKRSQAGIPDAETIRAAILECNGNFRKAGEVLGVTDSAVVKWCKKHGMEHRSLYYRRSARAA